MNDSVKSESLTDEEKKFIEKYRQLDDTEKEEIRQKILSEESD